MAEGVAASVHAGHVDHGLLVERHAALAVAPEPRVPEEARLAERREEGQERIVAAEDEAVAVGTGRIGRVDAQPPEVRHAEHVRQVERALATDDVQLRHAQHLAPDAGGGRLQPSPLA